MTSSVCGETKKLVFGNDATEDGTPAKVGTRTFRERGAKRAAA